VFKLSKLRFFLTFGKGNYVRGIATVEVPLRKESSDNKILIFIFVPRMGNTNFLAALPNALRKVTCILKFIQFHPSIHFN
jgi:hypothetical protein